MFKIKINRFLLLCLFIVTACNNAPKKSGSSAGSAEKKAATISVPAFNEDSAYYFVDKQVSFGPRVMNSPAHDKCADYLAKKLDTYLPGVIVQKGTVTAYNGTELSIRNIIGSFNPGSNDRIFLCSHWDSRPVADHDPDPKKYNKPIDGANDGASGVGILLEIARQISITKPGIGVDIIFFDAEDVGPPQNWKPKENTTDFWCLGSQFWARKQHVPDYFAKYGILLDMVGAPNATFLMEGISMEVAPEIVKAIWSAAGRIGYSKYFLFEDGPMITDDHAVINKIKGIPTIDIIHLDRTSETGFYPYWHTTGDNMKSIDRSTLKAVGQTLLTVIYEDR